MTTPPAEPRQSLSWRAALVEATFVVLGVVLALAANEWREARAQDRRAEAALETLRQELETNRSAVAEALDYHLSLSQELRRLSASGAGLPDRGLFSRGYVAPADLHHTAWDVAAATGVLASMPYDDVLVLSGVYEAQRGYLEQAREAGHLIFTRLFEAGHTSVLANHENLAIIIATFWYRECTLLERYDAALEHLGAAVDARPPPKVCTRIAAPRPSEPEGSSDHTSRPQN